MSPCPLQQTLFAHIDGINTFLDVNAHLKTRFFDQAPGLSIISIIAEARRGLFQGAELRCVTDQCSQSLTGLLACSAHDAPVRQIKKCKYRFSGPALDQKSAFLDAR